MDERTICQMEVHPTLIRLRRGRTELWKKWCEIYGPNALQNSQLGGGGLQQSLFAGLFGKVGSGPAGYPDIWSNP
jgi:hypothetical protein